MIPLPKLDSMNSDCTFIYSFYVGIYLKRFCILLNVLVILCLKLLDVCVLSFVFLFADEFSTVSLVAFWSLLGMNPKLLVCALDMHGLPKARCLSYPGDVDSKSPDTLKLRNDHFMVANLIKSPDDSSRHFFRKLA